MPPGLLEFLTAVFVALGTALELTRRRRNRRRSESDPPASDPDVTQDERPQRSGRRPGTNPRSEHRK